MSCSSLPQTLSWFSMSFKVMAKTLTWLQGSTPSVPNPTANSSLTRILLLSPFLGSRYMNYSLCNTFPPCSENSYLFFKFSSHVNHCLTSSEESHPFHTHTLQPSLGNHFLFPLGPLSISHII